METKEKVLVWVTKNQGERFNQIESNEERYKAFEEYLETVIAESKSEFKSNLETLEEDVAIYTGLMLKVKQAFEKAKSEQLQGYYALWEKFDLELPSTNKKVNQVLAILEPLAKKLNEMNSIFKSIQTWDINKFIDTLDKLNGLYGKNKEMVEFLVKNFNRDTQAK